MNISDIVHVVQEYSITWRYSERNVNALRYMCAAKLLATREGGALPGDYLQNDSCRFCSRRGMRVVMYKGDGCRGFACLSYCTLLYSDAVLTVELQSRVIEKHFCLLMLKQTSRGRNE